MTVLEQKIRVFGFPYLISFVAMVAGYGLFYWVCIERLHLFREHEFLVDFGLPSMFAIALAIGLIYPKRSIITEKNDVFGFGMLTLGTVWFAVVLLIVFIRKASGELVYVSKVTDIRSESMAKYYVIKGYQIVEKEAVTASDLARAKRQYNGKQYIAAPMTDTHADTVLEVCNYWVSWKFQDELSLQTDHVDSVYARQTASRLAQFKEEKHGPYTFFERLDEPGSRYQQAHEAIKNSLIIRRHKPVILSPHDEPFTQRTGNSFWWFLLSIFAGPALWLWLLHLLKVNKKALHQACRAHTNRR